MDTRSTAARRSIEKRNSIWSSTFRNTLRRQSTRTNDTPNDAEHDEIKTVSDGKLKPPAAEHNSYAWID